MVWYFCFLYFLISCGGSSEESGDGSSNNNLSPGTIDLSGKWVAEIKEYPKEPCYDTDTGTYDAVLSKLDNGTYILKIKGEEITLEPNDSGYNINQLTSTGALFSGNLLIASENEIKGRLNYDYDGVCVGSYEDVIFTRVVYVDNTISSSTNTAAPTTTTSEYYYYCNDGRSSTGCSTWFPLVSTKVYYRNTTCSSLLAQGKFSEWARPSEHISDKYDGACVVQFRN